MVTSRVWGGGSQDLVRRLEGLTIGREAREWAPVMETQTEHPHVVRNPQVCGGAPTIRGTRISVLQIAVMWKGGDTVEDIVQAFPHLEASQVYDAISFYLDHQQEIDREIEMTRKESISGQYGHQIDEKGFLRP